jgi:hypothetical protein
MRVTAADVGVVAEEFAHQPELPELVAEADQQRVGLRWPRPAQL